MTSKKYFFWVLGLSIGLPLAWVTYNLCSNDFGLWYSKDSCYIYKFERASKALLSQRHIPEYFNALLIGPSLSNNLDTSVIQTYRTYNLSLNGGNITELRHLADTAMDNGQFKMLIICMHPYTTQTYGFKGGQLQNINWRDAFFSELAFKVLIKKLLRPWDKQSQRQFGQSNWGTKHGQLNPTKTKKFVEKYRPYYDSLPQITPKPSVVYPQAVTDLESLIQNARKREVKIIAYYYPIFQGQFNKDFGIEGWNRYKQQVQHVFTKDDLVLDLNTPAYKFFSGDITNYTDGHLSDQGAQKLSKLLAAQIEQWHSQKFKQ